MKKVVVVLSGCVVYDGAEIHESVLTLLRLSERGVAYQCLAPNIPQMHVVNHLTGEVASAAGTSKPRSTGSSSRPSATIRWAVLKYSNRA